MSYHILHVADYGCRLSKERGLLVCKKDSTLLGKIAIEDLRVLVILNEAVSISGTLISELLERDVAVLYCKNYKPVGVSVPLTRTYDAKVVLNQSAGNKNLNSAIWRRLLRAKVENNLACLKLIGAPLGRLTGLSKKIEINEGLCAKEYWRHYFPSIGEFGVGRNPENTGSKANVFLNYAYGILGAMVYRAIIVAGLNHLLGVNHKTYYKNTPLVYDIIEPFRGFADFALYKFLSVSDSNGIREWAIFFGNYLKQTRIRKGIYSVKLLDCPNLVCESLANVYRDKKADLLWTPTLYVS